MTEPSPAFEVRASDAERDHVVELLQRHHVAGRLTLTELEERVTEAYRARTRSRLITLTADLPDDPPPGPPVDSSSPARRLDVEPWLPCMLWCVCPPAGLVWWLITRHAHHRLQQVKG